MEYIHFVDNQLMRLRLIKNGYTGGAAGGIWQIVVDLLEIEQNGFHDSGSRLNGLQFINIFKDD